MSGPARPLASTLPPAEGVLEIRRRCACLGRKTRAGADDAPCPYRFRYDYETKDGKRTGTCRREYSTKAVDNYWIE
jgi:hypothetical protein